MLVTHAAKPQLTTAHAVTQGVPLEKLVNVPATVYAGTIAMTVTNIIQ
jgi:hypothetical protein